MAEVEDKKPPQDARRTREERLAKALRDNLRRRKAADGRNDSDADPKP